MAEVVPVAEIARAAAPEFASQVIGELVAVQVVVRQQAVVAQVVPALVEHERTALFSH